MTAPTLEKAIECIEVLNNIKPGNINDASIFLTDLQKSSYAWMISDQLLYRNKDIYTAYFGAQTMRTKIQLHFDELPVDSHISLKESLMKHLLSSNNMRTTTVSKQLCLAIADLFCHMVQWTNSLEEIIHVFSQNAESVGILLDILKYIPEEFANKSLRLGINRKTYIFGDLEHQRLKVVSVIERSVSMNSEALLIGALDCLNAWFVINIFRDSDLLQSPVITLVYEVLERPNEASEGLFKSAVQCASDFFCHNVHRTPALIQLFQCRTYGLEKAYRLCESSKAELCLEYAKVFCEMAAALLPSVISSPRFDNAGDLGDVRTLHMLLLTARTNRECCAFVLDVLTDFSEDNDCPDDIRTQLEPIFEELIVVMTRHCAVIHNNEEQSLADFRADVFYVMEQIRVFVDIESLFRKMLSSLSQLLSNNTGDSINEAEAIICLIGSIVKFVDTASPENSFWTEQLLTAVILPNIGEAQASFKSVSFTMFGELCRWSSERPSLMDRMIREMSDYIVTTASFDESDELQMSALDAAMRSLSVFARRQPAHMLQTDQWAQVVAVCARLPQLPFVARETVAWYEALGRSVCVPQEACAVAALSQTPIQLAEKLWQLAVANLETVAALGESGRAVRTPKHPCNPSVWLDNVAAIFASMARLATDPTMAPADKEAREPFVVALYGVFEQYVWPPVAGLVDQFVADGHLIERTVRILRYALRAYQTMTKPLLGAIAGKLVDGYEKSRESCFIYLGGVLADEFGRDEGCREGLVHMFQALSGPAMVAIGTAGPAADPNTTEDLFRLMVRLVQHCQAAFLGWGAVDLEGLLDAAVVTLAGTSRSDTRMIALRLFVEVFACAQAAQGPARGRLEAWLTSGSGLARLLAAATHLCRWSPADLFDEDIGSDMADMLVAVRKLTDPSHFLASIDLALQQIGVSRSDGLLYATDEQIASFRNDLQHDKHVLRGLEEFAKLFT